MALPKNGTGEFSLHADQVYFATTEADVQVWVKTLDDYIRATNSAPDPTSEAHHRADALDHETKERLTKQFRNL